MPDDAEGPKPITEERVLELLTTGIREALSNFKPETPKIDVSSLAQEVAKSLKGSETAPKDKDKDPRVDPQVAQLRERLEALQREAEESKQTARNERLRNAVHQALLDGQAAPDRTGVAMDHLIANKRVMYTDDGSLVFVSQDKYGQTQHLPVAEGVKEFLNTDTGKMFLPPRSVQGTGSGAGDPGRVGGAGELSAEAATRMALNRVLSGRLQEE